MALKGSFLTPHGALVEYHKIIKVEVLCSAWETNPRVVVWVGMYATRELRETNANPLWVEYVEVPIAALASDPRALAYELVAADPRFAQTVAVLDPDPVPEPISDDPSPYSESYQVPLPPPPESVAEPVEEGV